MGWLAWMTSAEGWIALLTLTVLEIVLGIDNIVFISILAGKLPARAARARGQLGLLLAMFMRILLLLSITWVMGLTAPLFDLFGHGVSRPRSDPADRRPVPHRGRARTRFTRTSKARKAHAQREVPPRRSPASIVQILLLDIVFSLDSVITAVGMAERRVDHGRGRGHRGGRHAGCRAGAIGEFVERHPTVKMLALCFLLLIGVVADRRGLRPAHPEGLHLLRDGVLGVRRDDQPARSGAKSAPVRLHTKYRE